MPELVQHQLNCALLMRRRDGNPPPACSCGAIPDPTRPKSLDDVSGEEWNRASADYRAKIASPKFLREAGEQINTYLQTPLFDGMANDEASLGSPVDSEAGEAREAEVCTTSPTGGQKGVKKARFDLLPPEALARVAEHYGAGAEKYEVHNWRKGFDWSKSYASLQRHANGFWSGEDLDEDGLDNLAAVVFHALTLMTFQVEQPQYDDRFKKAEEQ